MTVPLGILGRILGLVGSRIDIGAITGIFGRARDTADRARALASKFRDDPELAALLKDAGNLLRVEGGKEITKEEIAAVRKHWGDLNDQQVHDRPKPAPEPPAPPVPEPPTPAPEPPTPPAPSTGKLHVAMRMPIDTSGYAKGQAVWTNTAGNRWAVTENAQTPPRVPGTDWFPRSVIGES